MPERQFAPLSAFADVTMGQSPDAASCNMEARGLLFLQGCAEFGATHPSAGTYCAPPLRVAKSGSVLISVRAPVGTMNYADQDYCIGRGLGAFKAKPGLANTTFLKHAVELNSSYLHRRSQGSTFAAVSTTDLRSVPVPVFSPEVQDLVASILTSVDTAIERTDALIAKHKQIKAGLMHDLFTRGVLPDGRLRPLRSEAPELYQETTVGWIPMGWTPSTLRQCLTESPTNGIYKPAGMIGEGMLMVGQTAFTEQRSIDFDLCRRGGVSKEEARRYGLAKDDILVTRVFATIEGVGLPTLVPQLIEPAVFESNMMRLRIDASIVKPRLLFEWLQSSVARRHITGGANASNQCSVNQGVLNTLPVGLPPQDEQTRITAGIEEADRQRHEIIESLSKLKMQKLGLMQDLLTGRVSVDHLVRESAYA